MKSRIYFLKVFWRVFLKFSLQKNKAATLTYTPECFILFKVAALFFNVFFKVVF